MAATKRRRDQQGESPAGKQQKSEVPPVLVLNKADSFKDNSELLSKKIDEDLKGINILKCQFTKNGNILIYPKTLDDYSKIVKNQ